MRYAAKSWQRQAARSHPRLPARSCVALGWDYVVRGSRYDRQPAPMYRACAAGCWPARLRPVGLPPPCGGVEFFLCRPAWTAAVAPQGPLALPTGTEPTRNPARLRSWTRGCQRQHTWRRMASSMPLIVRCSCFLCTPRRGEAKVGVEQHDRWGWRRPLHTRYLPLPRRKMGWWRYR
jgi:hypothetical protein